MSTVLHRCVTSVHFYSYFLIFSVPLQGEITPHTALPLMIFINTYMSSVIFNKETESSCWSNLQHHRAIVVQAWVYFYIKYIGKLLGLTNEVQRSMVLETWEFEQPKFVCML